MICYAFIIINAELMTLLFVGCVNLMILSFVTNLIDTDSLNFINFGQSVISAALVTSLSLPNGMFF